MPNSEPSEAFVRQIAPALCDINMPVDQLTGNGTSKTSKQQKHRQGGRNSALLFAPPAKKVPAPVGPYSGGYISRVSRIDANGNRTTLIDYLPSSQTNPDRGRLVSGIADVAFIGNTLYAHCRLRVFSRPRGQADGIFRINSDDTWTMIADLSAYKKYTRSPIPIRRTLSRMAPGTAWLQCVANCTQWNPGWRDQFQP